MGYHLPLGLGIDQSAPAFKENRTALPLLGYLLGDTAAYSSNPCGSTCFLNPLYDFLPRGGWIVDSGVCQRPSDFLFDADSQTMCCPSPDYCCPHSVANCSAAGVTLFDVDTANGGKPVEARHLVDGWRRHFHVVEKKQNAASLCFAEKNEWNGGSRQPACFWAMTNPSVARVRETWANAAPLPELHNDDDTHAWKGHHH